MSDYSELKRLCEEYDPGEFESIRPGQILNLIAENKSLRGNCKALGKSARVRKYQRIKREVTKILNENEKAKESIMVWIRLHDDRIAENKELKIENDRLCEDLDHAKRQPLYSTRLAADRYRWLRENNYYAHVQVMEADGSMPYVYGEELDRAVDFGVTATRNGKMND